MDHPIFDVIELLKKARQAEAEYALALADARAFTEHVRSICLAEAYQHGQIDGKNEQARKIQEVQFLVGQEELHKAESKQRELSTKHVAAEIEMQHQGDRLRAMLAPMQTSGEQSMLVALRRAVAE